MGIVDIAYCVVDPGEYVSDDVIEYKDPIALFNLSGGRLDVRLTTPASSVAEARALIDPIVRAWEFQAEVQMGFPVIKFEFTPAEVVLACYSASPSPAHQHAAGSEYGTQELVIQLHYPPGPTIRVTPEMENIWARFSRACLGIGEPLQAAVYYSLTLIEAQFGSRAKAAASMSLAPPVLRKIGELTATRGDAETARKARATSTPLTRSETKWLEHAVRHVVLQLGHIAAGLTPPPLSMAELPDL